MSVFSTDEHSEQLFLRGEEVFAEDGEIFDLLGSNVADVMISEIPRGIRVRLCDKVLGSTRDLFGRQPDAVFETSSQSGLIAHLSTVIVPPTDGSSGKALRDFFDRSLESGERSLDSLRSVGRLLAVERSIYDDIAYLNCSLVLYDQTFAEAEAFLTQIDDRVSVAHEPPQLFVCHASEDEPFVEQLVSELDRRAMYAWYDKREIVVGDSIVERINEGLEATDYLVAVLSPRSVAKPWVSREMSSSLMRQLGGKRIRILPVLLEPCQIPSLLADLKYADFSESFEHGMAELMSAIRGRKIA